MKSISLIAAMTKERIIGKGNEIPWRIPDDLDLFKRITLNGIVVMGKNTWLSIPERYRPLSKRVNIVVSRTLGPQKGAILCRSIGQALSEAELHNGELYCIGGAQLYQEMLPMAKVMHISWVKKDYQGDKRFPAIGPEQWKVVETVEYKEFTYKQYSRLK